MKGILILILLYIASISISTAQTYKSLDTNDITIEMVGNLGDFKVSIAKEVNTVKLKFQVKDSVAEQDFARDPKYKKVYKAFKNYNMGLGKRFKNIMLWVEGYQKYTVYSSDSLFFDADSATAFTTLIRRIGSTKKEDLFKPSLFYIDGFDINFAIRTSEKFTEFEAHSPNGKSSPLLKDLLHQLVLFSKTTKKNLLRRTVVKSY